MRDCFGVELEVGQKVGYWNSCGKHIRGGTIVGFTAKKVKIQYGTYATADGDYPLCDTKFQEDVCVSITTGKED